MNVAIAFLTSSFMIFFLGALTPDPRDPLRGDYRNMYAICAAILAGVVVYLLLEMGS